MIIEYFSDERYIFC